MSRVASFRVWTYVSLALVAVASALVLMLASDVRLLTALVLPPFVAGLTTTPRRTALIVSVSVAAAITIAAFMEPGLSKPENLLRIAVIAVGSALAPQVSILRERDLRTRRRLALINSARRELDGANGIEDDLASFARAAVIGFAEWAFADLRLDDGQSSRIVAEAEHSRPAAKSVLPRGDVDSVAASFAIRAEREGPVHLRDVDGNLLDSLFENVEPRMREGVELLVVPVSAGNLRATYFLVCSEPHPPWAEAELTQVTSLAQAAAFLARTDQLIDQLTYSQADLRASRDEVEAIVGGIADGLVAQDKAGNMVYVNDFAAKMFGFESADELIGSRFDEVHPRMEIRDEDGNPFDREQLPSRRALRGEAMPEAMLRYTVKSTGREWWTLVKARAIIDRDGNPTMTISIIEDLTRHRQEDLAQKFLADAAKLLAEPGAVGDTAERLAQACVPRFADWCAVELVDPHGSIERCAVLPGECAAETPAAPAAENVVSSGVPELLRRSDDGELPAKINFTGDAVAHHALVAPITARGKPIGAITLALTRAGTRFAEYDVETALELGRRAGVAIEEARDQANRDRMLSTLQTSLLPASLPEFAGLEIAARFRPSEVDVDVSGDFYDVFEMGDGSIALVIGDVCGKGPEAAATTALARYTIRVEAMRVSDPAALLSTLNRAMLHQQLAADCFISLAIVRLMPVADGSATIDLVSGGHPLPIIVHGAAVAATGESGTLIGVVPDPVLPLSNSKLDRGDVIVLYTDGLAAGSTTDDVGFAISLIEGISAQQLSADELAGAIDAEAFARNEAPSRDDVAILVVKLA